MINHDNCLEFLRLVIKKLARVCINYSAVPVKPHHENRNNAHMSEDEVTESNL